MSAAEIIPNLWMGSFPNDLAFSRTFDYIVLCAKELQASTSTFPNDVKGILYCPLDDGSLDDPAEIERAEQCAAQISHWIWEKRKVLVTCAEGRNRSGLVTALALINLGWEPEAAIERIREKRILKHGPGALNNPYFVEYLKSRG